MPVIIPKTRLSYRWYETPSKSNLKATKNVKTETINPDMEPTQLYIGLISGKLFFLPNFVPKKKAAVSHSQMETNTNNVIFEL